MNRRGFTLIEVIVVLVLITILLSFGTMQFSEYIRKGAVENQTKELYADLMLTRAAALTQRSPKQVIITPNVFTFVSSALGGGMSSNRTSRVLSKPVTWSGKSASETETRIIFDERGTFNIDISNGNTTICVSPSLEAANYDSIVVFSTRIHLGKVVFGGECTSENVTVK